MQNKMIQGHKRTPIVLNSVAKWTIFLLEGQVHGSAHAHLSKCCFSAGTSCIAYASNIIMS